MPYTQQETLQVGAKLAAMNTHRLLIAATFSMCSFSAFAQWQWVDDTGRKVFSDRPPPAHISPKQILQQPAGARVIERNAPVLYPSADNLSESASVTLAKAQAEKEAKAAAEQAQRQAQQAQDKAQSDEAAKDKAQEEAQQKAQEAERKQQEAQQAKARKDNCQRAQTAQKSLQSGGLQAYVNEKGERGIMTEPVRNAELQRAQKAIKDNCK